MRKEYNMDFGWRFFRGEPDSADENNTHSAVYISSKSGAAGGPAGKEYNDRDWRTVDLPHDYFTESEMAECYLLSGGYRKPDNAWYRKTFLLDDECKDKCLTLCFDGTAVNADFYFNGSLMARSFSAYTPTVFDITDRAYFDGRPNVLAVHIYGFGKELWSYEGAGIYRHVRLIAKASVHITHDGIFAKPILKKNTENDWELETEIELYNGGDTKETVGVQVTLLDGDIPVCSGRLDDINVPFCSKTTACCSVNVEDPVRWDVENPKLYRVKAQVIKDGKPQDEDLVKIGFRTINIDADKGFFLNGRPLKIKGACCHQDHAGVGVAVPDTLAHFRIRQLKKMGINAYRTAHNLPAKEILDACDEYGMLVMDENRRFESNETVLEYLRIMVRRDRNHPSVIFYSLFNEETLQTTEEGARIYRHMKNTVRQLDDTRFITGAINSFEPYEGTGVLMDVLGLNYGLFSIQNVIEKTHKLLPNQPIIGSETVSATTTRGCYATDKENRQILSSYDGEHVSWGNTIAEIWDFTRKNAYYSGIFVWTGFDYRGEPTPFRWPSVSSQFGAMDTCGFPKSAFYYYQACFTQKPMVKLIPHWNWKQGETVRVVAVTNCEEAELFLNGKSLGRKPADPCAQPEWQVPFESGELQARVYKNGRFAAEDKRQTAGKPYRLKAEAVCNSVWDSGEDVFIVNCSVTDENGTEIETADNTVTFHIEGDGVLLGVGNGDPNSHESDVLPIRRLFAGKCQAIFRVLSGAKKLEIHACAEGLEEAVIKADIYHQKAPLRIESIENYIIYGITQSVVSESRPDPLIALADNDMNTFTPAGFSYEHYQYDFVPGWRIYRAIPMISAELSELVLEDVRAAELEIYVNGRKIHSAKDTEGEVRCTFEAVAGQKVEIRILIRGEHSDGNGFKRSVQLIPTENKEKSDV